MTPFRALFSILVFLTAAPALAAPGGQDAGKPLQETAGFIAVEGGQLFYRESGEGPPVVLLHGGFLDHRMWDGQVAALAASHRVVRYDIRSHGQSAAEALPFSDSADLAALMDALGMARATLVGLSMGGQIAVDFALQHPERVASLVLVGSGLSGFPFDSPGMGAYIGELNQAVEAGDFGAMLEVFTRYWCDGPYRSPEQVDPAVRAKVLAMLAGSQQRWEHNHLSKGLERPAMGRVASITAPTLVVLGLIDMPEIVEIAEHLVANIAGAQRADIPGVAHMVNMEAPERFNSILVEFLDGP